MQLNDSEKRWLEINFFLLCKKIFNNREMFTDVENFFKAFEWTNLYDYDILIKTLNNECLLYNPNVQPSKREFLLMLDLQNCRFKYDKYSLHQLAKPLGFKISNTAIYTERMRQEVAEVKQELYPKFTTKGFHDAYYSFLLALRYCGVLYSKHIKL